MGSHRDRQAMKRRLRPSVVERLESRSLLTGPGVGASAGGPLFYQPSGPGPDAITLRRAGLDLEIVDNGAVVASRPLVLVTSVAIRGSSSGSDSFTLDERSGGAFAVPGGISFSEGWSSAASLNILGDGISAGVYTPTLSTLGSGSLSIGSQSVIFGNLGSVAVGNLSSMTVITPGAGNSLTVDSPSTAINRVSGLSQGVAITPLTFSSVAGLTLNTALHDRVSMPDSIVIGPSGLVASGLANFSVVGGVADQSLTILSPGLSLPVDGGAFSAIGGSGNNTVSLSADVDFFVTSTTLAVPGSGTLSLSHVQNLRLTGGPSTRRMDVVDWSGNLVLDGGSGNGLLRVTEPGRYEGSLGLDHFQSTTILIQGDFAGRISAPTTMTIQSIAIGGSDLPGSSIEAGSFGGSAQAPQPAILVLGDLKGRIQAVEDLSIAGSGTLSSIRIGGNLGITGQVLAGDIGTLSTGLDLAGQVVAEGSGTIGIITVGGDLSGSVRAPEDSHPGSGNITEVDVDGNLTGTVSTGNISTLKVGKDLEGIILAEGSGTIGTITVGGNLSGSVSAPEDSNPGSGNIIGIDVGGDLTGTVSTGNISTLQVGKDLEGVILAQGSGTIGTITVGGNLSGSVSAPEDSNPGSGNITGIDVGGNLTGTVSTGNISTLQVGKDLEGVILAQGSGTIGTITVGGDLSGSVTAPEDSNPGSGNIIGIDVGGDLTGTVSTGNISTLQVGKDLEGVILAQGLGSIGNVTVGGDFGGTLSALIDANPGSGTIESLRIDGTFSGRITSVRRVGSALINAVSPAGMVEAGDVTTNLTINLNSGSIRAGNVANFYGVNLRGVVNLGKAGSVEYRSLAAGSELNASSIDTLVVDEDVAGSIHVEGNLHSLIVRSGSILAGSVVHAGSLDSATIGLDMAGRLEVDGTLGSLVVGGATPGLVIAEHVGTIYAGAGVGPVVLQVVEAGVRRTLEASTAANPFPQPGQSPGGSLEATTFRYLYESGSLAHPQLSVRVDNGSGDSSPGQFDLSLVAFGASAKFNLAGLGAAGVSGIGNVSVEGDILDSTSSLATASFPGEENSVGIDLPFDHLAGVGVRDFIPAGGLIRAASIQGLSAGRIGRSDGSSVTGASAGAFDAQNLLAPETRIVQASATFRIPFSGDPAYRVGFFFDDQPWGGFDWSSVAFGVQDLVTVDASGRSNVVTRSNADRGAVIALVKVDHPSDSFSSEIRGINIRGDGASISTFQWINGPIVSSGTLGDLTLLNYQPVGDITASSIFGTITTFSQLNSTIQTTGLHTDPTTGDVSAANGDFGRVYLNSSGQLTSTQFVTYFGSFSGRLIVRGRVAVQRHSHRRI